MDLYYRLADGDAQDTVEVVTVDAAEGPQGVRRLVVRLWEEEHVVDVLRSAEGELVARIDGRSLRAFVAPDGDTRLVQLPGQAQVTLERVQSARVLEGARAATDGAVTASTPAQVVKVLVAEGDLVTRGDTLVILEAMKMEFRMTAPCDGVVLQVGCGQGDVVDRGQLLVEVGQADGT